MNPLLKVLQMLIMTIELFGQHPNHLAILSLNCFNKNRIKWQTLAENLYFLQIVIFIKVFAYSIKKLK